MTIYIDFQITSETEDINLDFIFQRKGSYHKIGDISKTGIVLNYSQYNICFPEIETHSIDDSANDFFNYLDLEKKALLIDYIEKKECSVLVYFVVKNFENEYFYFDLSKENIKRFSEISASISVDGL